MVIPIELLSSNYAHHPGFEFPVVAMTVDEVELHVFAQAFEMMRTVGSTLEREALRTAHADAHASLRRVFAALDEQCLDDHETRFLSELLRQVQRLLNEQLKFNQEQNFDGPIAHVSATAARGVTALVTERHFVSTLPEDAVSRIESLAAPEIARLRAVAASGQLKREALSVTDGPVVAGILRLLNDAFRQTGVLAAVSTYSGATMEVSGAALELSVPQADWWRNSMPKLRRPPTTMYAHVDESIDHPKAIVYLTDVGATNGPTSCYPGVWQALALHPLQELVGRVIGTVGANPDSPLYAYYGRQYHQSMASETARRHFMRLPPQLRFNSHFGWDVMPDGEMEALMQQRERVLTGPAGSFIVFDGATLLHRGGLIEEGERVVLQVIFSVAGFKRKIVRKIRSWFK